MKIIIESSVYLIVMVLICIIGIDFISMNREISKLNQVEQYIEDYIEIYGSVNNDNTLDAASVNVAKDIAKGNGMQFSYVYETKTKKYTYYRILVSYTLKSKVFNISKSDSYVGLVRVDSEG